MIDLAFFVLYSWIPVVILLFAMNPPRRAVVVATITAWLFLPNLGLNLPGLPDYTKTSSTTFGVILGALIFDAGTLLAFRPRWFDLPMVAWCLAPFAASVSNDLGVYDGCSGTLTFLVQWGFPYLIGRVYLSDPEGLRELAMGVIVGGLIYVPLCLIEIRLSPVVAKYVYGLGAWEGVRFGGFRPRVFMGTGLELGMWMTAASLTAYWLWADGALKQWRGIPFGWLLLPLLVTTVLCKSTGALVLLAAGMLVRWSIHRTGRSFPIWILLTIAPLYMVTRASSSWSANELVTLSRSAFGEERAQSLEFRLYNEDLLIAKALRQPFFGWGGWSRARVFNANGRDLTITDGYWIIALGNQGLFGLASLTTLLLLPAALLTVRYRVRDWKATDLSPALALAVLLALYMIDNLSNAMMNPIYALAVGGLLAFVPGWAGGRSDEGEGLGQPEGRAEDPESGEHPAGPPPGVVRPCVEGAEDLDPRYRLVEGQRTRADQLAAAGRFDAAIDLYRRTIRTQEGLVARHPAVASYRGCLARTCIDLGRLLGDSGLAPEEKQVWSRALEILSGLVEEFPDAAEYRGQRLDLLNNLTWLLATNPDPAVADTTRAVAWAAQAVEQAPDNPAYWNTLGVARYMVGDWLGAVEALIQAVELGSGGTSFDHFYLALALARCGEHAAARLWYDKAVAWMEEYQPRQGELLRLRGEAAALFTDPRTRTTGDPPRKRLAPPRPAMGPTRMAD